MISVTILIVNTKGAFLTENITLQFHSIGQLYSSEIGNGLFDFPIKRFLIFCNRNDGVDFSIGLKSISSILNIGRIGQFKLLIVDGQAVNALNYEVVGMTINRAITHNIFDLGTLVYQVPDIILNLSKIHILTICKIIDKLCAPWPI